MHEEIKRAILDSIRAHERIILTRHLRPDGDAVGSEPGSSAGADGSLGCCPHALSSPALSMSSAASNRDKMRFFMVFFLPFLHM